jgi:transposase
LTAMHAEVRALEDRIAALETQLGAIAATDRVITQLRTIPGIGLLTATPLVGSVGHIHAFRRARQFASWIGLTPREYSSGPHRRLGGISKRGDVYLRCLLTHGAGRAPGGATPGRAEAAAHAPPAMGRHARRATRTQ